MTKKINELITVIVPVYKVENYLPKCIETIINQTYKNLEIILVDDGSPDNCPKICDEYAKKDKRIKVIHKENEGLSASRNKGIENATGAYLSFIDSDDYIDIHMIEELYKNLKETNSDISVCSYYKTYPDKIEEIKMPESSRIISGIDKYQTIYNKYSGVITCAWNKLYKKEIFKTIRYPKGLIMEDSYILTDLLKTANKISYIQKPLYYYVQREDSIMHQFNLKRLDSILHYEKKIKFCLENNLDDILQHIKLKYIRSITNNLIPGLYSIQEFEKAKELLQKSKKIAKEIKVDNTFTTKQKIQIYLIGNFPKTYIKLKSLIRR